MEQLEDLTLDELLFDPGTPHPAVQPPPQDAADVQLKAIIEAAIYITDEPLTLDQIAAALEQPVDRVKPLLDQLVAEYDQPERGIAIRELAGGYKMTTRAEHHEAIRTFVKSLKPPLKLSIAALETLSAIAYKQPVTAPEIMEIRGVQGAGVLKTLIDRKLIAASGRKQVIGKPILYRTTKEFLIQFGLKDLSELPTLKEFEELGRLALNDEPGDEIAGPKPPPEPDTPDPGPERPDHPEPFPHEPVPVDTQSGPNDVPPAEPPPVQEPEPAPQPVNDPPPEPEPKPGPIA